MARRSGRKKKRTKTETPPAIANRISNCLLRRCAGDRGWNLGLEDLISNYLSWILSYDNGELSHTCKGKQRSSPSPFRDIPLYCHSRRNVYSSFRIGRSLFEKVKNPVNIPRQCEKTQPFDRIGPSTDSGPGKTPWPAVDGFSSFQPNSL